MYELWLFLDCGLLLRKAETLSMPEPAFFKQKI